MFITGNIPFFNAWLDEAFLHGELPGADHKRLEVEVFGFTSLPRRCALFTAMSVRGTQHARVPIHYLWREKGGGEALPLDHLQLWDMLSPYFTAFIADYTKNGRAKILLKDRQTVEGDYLMTFDWCFGPEYQGGYAEMAAGHKTASLFWLPNGQLALQPNNRILHWMDGGSFVSSPLKGNPGWKIFPHEFSCERAGSRWLPQTEEEAYFYEFEKAGGNGALVSSQPAFNHQE